MLYVLSLVLESILVYLVSLLFRENMYILSLLLMYCTIRPMLGGQTLMEDVLRSLFLPAALSFARFHGNSSLSWTTASAILLAGSVATLLVKYRDRYIRKREKTITGQAHAQLLATLAHEIRTPLTIMQTTENVLMEQIPGPLNARQKKFMESIFINTHRLIGFSENMLTLLKLERDWQPDLSKPIDLRLLIRQVSDTMQPMLMIKQQQLKCSFPALLSRPKADESWIRQVLINLIHNASKHTGEQGSILITVTQDDRQVVVTVTDTGHGLLGSERETLFKEFYQESQDAKEFQDGFGLGLSIVRTIIERHRGKVYITSTKEMGTMVSFNLPAEASR